MRHGTLTAANRCTIEDGKRCIACRAARNRYARRRGRGLAEGTWEGLVDAGPARDHLAQLTGAGVSRKQIVAMTGLGESVLRRIRFSITTRIQAATAAAILATPYRAPEPWDLTDATGTRRRLQALIREGWALTDVSDESGIHVGLLTRALNWQPHVRVRTAQAVAKATDTLAGRKPPNSRYATRSRGRARDNGWAPLAAWDDIDNPNDTPHGVLKEAS